MLWAVHCCSSQPEPPIKGFFKKRTDHLIQVESQGRASPGWDWRDTVREPKEKRWEKKGTKEG